MAKRFALKAKLDTSSVDSLRNELVAAHGEDLIIDGAQVELLGGLCTELLLSAQHLWQKQNKTLNIENPSNALADNLTLMGLALDDISTGEAA